MCEKGKGENLWLDHYHFAKNLSPKMEILFNNSEGARGNSMSVSYLLSLNRIAVTKHGILIISNLNYYIKKKFRAVFLFFFRSVFVIILNYISNIIFGACNSYLLLN